MAGSPTCPNKEETRTAPEGRRVVPDGRAADLVPVNLGRLLGRRLGREVLTRLERVLVPQLRFQHGLNVLETHAPDATFR